jgi:hypothetical protein
MVFACKVYFTLVFTQIIDLYTKNENNLHKTLIIKHKKVVYITQKKGAEAPIDDTVFLRNATTTKYSHID